MPEETSTILLSAFAKVHAALAAGHPLSRALSWAEVASDRWSPAEAVWKERLMESAAGDCSLLVAYDAHVLRAADLLAPRIEPIESDVVAWTHFSRNFAAAVDPNAFCASCGLQIGDVLRLQRLWAEKRAADPALAAQALAASRAPLDPVPPLRVEPRSIGEYARPAATEPAQAGPPTDEPGASVPSSPVSKNVPIAPEIVFAPSPLAGEAHPAMEAEPQAADTQKPADLRRRSALPFGANAPPTLMPRIEGKERTPMDARLDGFQTMELQAVVIPDEMLRAALPFNRPSGSAPIAPVVVLPADSHETA